MISLLRSIFSRGTSAIAGTGSGKSIHPAKKYTLIPLVGLLLFSLSGCFTLSGGGPSNERSGDFNSSSKADNENKEGNNNNENPFAPFQTREYKIGKIKEVLKEDSLLALQLYLTFEKEQKDSNAQENSETPDKKIDITELKKEILFLIVNQCKEAVEAKEFKRAMALYNTLDLIDETKLFKELTLIELNRLYLDSLIENGYNGVAALFIQEHKNPQEISTPVLIKAMESFSLTGHVAGLRATSSLLKKRGVAIPQKIEDAIKKKPSMEELVSGTVTIIVDKGIKIEKGIGRPSMELGSGFFVDKSGYIMTNHHVIASQVDPEYTGYTRLYISLSGDLGERIPAKVIGWDDHFDLALIKVELDAPYVYSFSKTRTPGIGTSVTAIGSPLGLTRTVTRGTLSAVGRELLTLGTVYQVDAPINPGNSGGPLLNDEGEVMAIVFAGAEKYEGINFAIPGEYAKMILSDLFKGGKVEHSWLGVGANKDLKNIETLYTVPDSPAEYADIRKGDCILSINGEKVTSISDVQRVILNQGEKTLLKVKWKRENETFEKWMALTTMPRSPIETILKLDYQEHLFSPIFGMDVESIGNNEARIFTYKRYRVTKVYPGGVADSNGFSKDDTIILKKWFEDYKQKVIIAVMFHTGIKSGGMETMIQMGSYMKSNAFY